jgi:CDP-6-deoxy-D-xylo-4-hexulose-3-dehydrase
MFEAYGDEEIEAVTESLRAGWLAPGPRTAQFEEEVANFFGKKFGVFVNSGSSANMLALLVAGVSEGVEVVTPALTFSTVIAPLLQLRAKIIFCDAMPTTYVSSVDQVMAAITQNTKVVFLPNLIGSKPDWAGLRKSLADAVRAQSTMSTPFVCLPMRCGPRSRVVRSIARLRVLLCSVARPGSGQGAQHCCIGAQHGCIGA